MDPELAIVISSFPLTALDPDQAPEAEQLVELEEDHVSVITSPTITDEEDDEIVTDLIETTTTSNLPTSTTTTIIDTTTTTEVTYEGCVPENNENIDFTNLTNVQNFLNGYGFDAGPEDGMSGSQTREALKRFQAYVGVTIDGDLGPTTYGKMRSYTGCETKINDYVPETTTTTTMTITAAADMLTTTVASNVDQDRQPQPPQQPPQ